MMRTGRRSLKGCQRDVLVHMINGVGILLNFGIIAHYGHAIQSLRLKTLTL